MASTSILEQLPPEIVRAVVLLLDPDDYADLLCCDRTIRKVFAPSPGEIYLARSHLMLHYDWLTEDFYNQGIY
ncbi:hypothetical protein HDU96_000920, partial [Phlyctochytrium bullatum]